MHQSALDLLTKHRVGALTTLLPDGSPHSSALHYSIQANPLEIYFSTENTSLKTQNLLSGKTAKASFVIGFSEEEWKTLQMDGDIEAVFDKAELQSIHKIHYAKNPSSEQYKDDPATIFLKFTPRWWRYTDYNTSPPTVIDLQK